MASEIPTAEYDVVVVGGGAAGVAAAVGAARRGSSVALVEQYGFLGGAAANSSVLAYCGFFDQTKEQVVRGIGQDFLDELEKHDLYRLETYRNSGNTVVVLDLETTKAALDDLVQDAGVELFLHSTLVSAETGNGSIRSVDIVHRGGLMRLAGKAFADCSGDGVLLGASNAPVHLSPVDQRQASTMVMRVGGVAEDADRSCEGQDLALKKYASETGITLTRSNGTCVRMPLSGELMLLLADEHMDALDVRDLTKAEQRTRATSRHYLNAYAKYLDGWQDAYLAATGPQIGIRESRRMIGQESVTAQDVLDARKRPQDAIARCGWPMEDHAVPGATSYSQIRDKGWYHIPYGAITSQGVDNLWAAGRLASADNRAFASLRVMGTAFATGHAAGVAAAMFSAQGHVDVAALRENLAQQGALV